MPAKSSLSALLAIAVAALPAAAPAQPVECLTRPVERATATGIEVDERMTFGNLVVGVYGGIGRKLQTPDLKPETIAIYKQTLCGQSATNAVVGYAVEEALKDIPKADRKRLRTGEPDSLTDLAIRVAAKLDKVSPDAIRADEAIGPGAYHDVIAGFRFGLEACRFYGIRL